MTHSVTDGEEALLAAHDPILARAPDGAPNLSARLAKVVEQLVARGDKLTTAEAAATLADANISMEDVEPFVEERVESYARRCVTRTDTFELLVLTWRPGQGSAAHDHAGSSCCLRIISGAAVETCFHIGTDGMAQSSSSRRLEANEVLVDSGSIVHRLENPPDAGQCLVTLHVYLPPLPELRRYAVAPPNSRIAAPFLRAPRPGTTTVAIVGSGFSGTMAAAHLMLQASHSKEPLHISIFEKHSALGEGAAYRTPNDAHLLNVPAGRMSAWPNEPNGFVAWAQTRDPSVTAKDFLPRNWYADYLRTQLFAVAEGAYDGVSAELCREEVESISRAGTGEGFVLRTRAGRAHTADGVAFATGHLPPLDPFARRWQGSRARYIADPWASLALGSIQSDEPVLVIGTSLTAIDVLLTLGRRERTAPIIAISRRGLLPATHASSPLLPLDASAWVEPLCAQAGGLRARQLLAVVREVVRDAHQRGEDWRAVIDSIRPHTAALWSAFSEHEARRFLRHLRVFWEVHRHRMAPAIGTQVARAIESRQVQVVAGRVLASVGDLSGVSVSIQRRGCEVPESLRVAWVINCTGPGDVRNAKEPSLQSLIESGELLPDALGLGVHTGAHGQARNHRGDEHGDLVVVGTLRKADLWESTAVPELRVQAAEAAEALWQHLSQRRVAGASVG